MTPGGAARLGGARLAAATGDMAEEVDVATDGIAGGDSNARLDTA
ncbi:MAG: hypothetical protein ACR2GB_01040 [Nocardioidaceae bacterium]